MDPLDRLLDHLLGTPGRSQYLDARRQVTDYAQFLERAAPMPGQVADANQLPHPKGELKLALLLCLGGACEEKVREQLEAGYLMLSAFQEGVGRPFVGADFAGLDLDTDPEEVALALERAYLEASPWRRLAMRELQRLREELQQLQLVLGGSPS
ncbi:hypothetical protein E4634_10430 [Mangrovimicrobium sediminis]|uniref:Uncharacterized protein n=1 Tax=Mangrovimicrobium sediminis TaxID=2562682 RepID=A0A4Z0M1G4_9GAMM|nr:hypothetical protein [Haliea sp. SAOS-164]TGD73442.1 hypothetical protein E4634_10430 [Haliea sp. SAOS-164]